MGLGCAVGTDVDTAVASGAAVAFAGEAARALGRSTRTLTTPALPDFVEDGWVGEVFGSGGADDAAAAGEVFAPAAGRSEF